MRARFHTQCRVPVDSYLRWELGSATLIGKLPFVPPRGMSLQVSPSVPAFRVDEVRWSCTKADEIEVFFLEPESPAEAPLSIDLQAEGWQVVA